MNVVLSISDKKKEKKDRLDLWLLVAANQIRLQNFSLRFLHSCHRVIARLCLLTFPV